MESYPIFHSKFIATNFTSRYSPLVKWKYSCDADIIESKQVDKEFRRKCYRQKKRRNTKNAIMRTRTMPAGTAAARTKLVLCVEVA